MKTGSYEASVDGFDGGAVRLHGRARAALRPERLAASLAGPWRSTADEAAE